MMIVESHRTARPLGSYELGTLLLLGLFVAPLAFHVIAGVAL
jgi:hypothetical protein